MDHQSQKRYEVLIDGLKRYERVGVAFSGGVDSTLLLYAACQTLGKENVFVLYALSELLSEAEKNEAATLLDHLGIAREMLLAVQLHPLDWPDFVRNSAERCYICKKRMYRQFLAEIGNENCFLLLDGSNIDDLQSTRPGFRAIGELGVKTPLLDAQLTKEDIRFLAHGLGLPNHDKPSNSCLATRFPEGIMLRKEGLELVEKGESFLEKHGFRGCRVRPETGDKVILQVTAGDMEKFVESSERNEIVGFFRSCGFGSVLLDLHIRQ